MTFLKQPNLTIQNNFMDNKASCPVQWRPVITWSEWGGEHDLVPSSFLGVIVHILAFGVSLEYRWCCRNDKIFLQESSWASEWGLVCPPHSKVTETHFYIHMWEIPPEPNKRFDRLDEQISPVCFLRAIINLVALKWGEKGGSIRCPVLG